MAQTRSSTEVWLPEKGTDQLSGSHLPTNRDARFPTFDVPSDWTEVNIKRSSIKVCV